MKKLGSVFQRTINYVGIIFGAKSCGIRFPLYFLSLVLALAPLPANAAAVSLAWVKSPDPDIAGYKMHYGNSSGNYQYTVNVGNSTSCTISGLNEGTTYYFAATAYDSQQNESGFSNEVKAYVLPKVVQDPVGSLDYCRDFGPCAAGEGDCDNDSECASGLTCVQVIGTDTCQQSSTVTLPVGDLDYCRDFGPCGLGEGDCDNDSECASGLTCVQVIGTDTCQQSSTVTLPVGDLDYCRDFGPCGIGEGDCDSDSECASGLTCVQVTGTDTCQSSSLPVGDLDYCRDFGPCSAGQGDCDNDGECQSGLICAQVPGVDICQNP